MKKRRIRRLSRGQKAVRNFVVLALVLTACWALYQTPYWLLEYDIKQEAQENVEILWKGMLNGDSASSKALLPSGSPMIIAVGDEQLYCRYYSNYEGNLWVSGEYMPSLSPGRPVAVLMRELWYSGALYGVADAYLISVGLPENAANGQIEIVATNGDTYSISGTRDMSVIWFPVVIKESENAYFHFMNGTYRLTLFDENGNLLSQTNASLGDEV